MAQRILLIIPDRDLGEHLRKALVDAGGYRVELAHDAEQALTVSHGHSLALTILDCAAVDVPPAELAGALTASHPHMHIILIPPGNDRMHPVVSAIRPQAILIKPFYIPDLLDAVAMLVGPDQEEFAESAPAVLSPAKTAHLAPAPEAQAPQLDAPVPWLEDVNRAAQYLARLSLETAARAALIARGEQLWAYAGELGQPTGDELAATVGRQWSSQGGNDLARFITLENDREYMLYATGLGEGLVLALIFDARMPFSKMRTQSNQLARALSNDPAQSVEFAPAGALPTADADHPHPAEDTRPFEAIEPGDLPAGWLPAGLTGDWKPLQAASQQPVERPTSAGPRAYLEDLLGEPLPLAALPPARRPAPAPEPPVSIFDSQPIYPPPETMADNRPVRTPSEAAAMQLEPESASYFSITYACVLLPRMPQHHLVSDLARHVEEWMGQICLSFDWRIEQLAIRPDYMQWMVRVHSATAPRFLMQIVTRLTSERIFEHFPRLLAENPSGEFWAPGWMVITSPTLPEPQLVQDFVRKTRQRQGLG